MTALPSTLKIGPFVYTVEQNAKKLQEFEREKKGGYSGYSSGSKREIVLNEDEPIQNIRETLWHEVKHQVCNLFGLPDEAELKEEAWISATAPLEWMVLRENPDLVAFLTAEN